MRTYNDRCGIARALDVVGDRWALLVVRDLLLGPKRFSDLRAGLRRVTADVLSQRLRELEAARVVQRRRLAAAAPPAPGLRPPPRGAGLGAGRARPRALGQPDPRTGRRSAAQPRLGDAG